jgi:hypothetical protein
MARKRKNDKQNATEAARIVVEYKKGKGTTVRVEKAYSPEHAVWLLAQAIQILVTQGDKEETTDESEHDVSELSSGNDQEPNDVPDVH